MVGFILMKVSSFSHSVSPPKITTTMPVTNGMIGSRRVRISETTSAISVATMNRAVATKIGPPSAASAGKRRRQLLAAGIGEEEDAERPELEHEFQERIDRLPFGRIGGGLEGHEAWLKWPARASSPEMVRVISSLSRE